MLMAPIAGTLKPSIKIIIHRVVSFFISFSILGLLIFFDAKIGEEFSPYKCFLLQMAGNFPMPVGISLRFFS
jgi:hypothetical protein